MTAQTARALAMFAHFKVLGRRGCGTKITDDVGKNAELDSAISGEDDEDDDDEECMGKLKNEGI